ncbi:sensor histidine kinase, partial [Pseudomonas amygdali pv. mori str. 301020]
MIRRFDTLFARLFGGALLAILLAHLLAFIWFTQYGMRPPPDDRPDAQHSQDDQGRRHRPPPGGPLVLLFFQFVTLIVAAWYGAKALSRPVQRLSEAAERLSEDLDSPPLEISGPQEAR